MKWTKKGLIYSSSGKHGFDFSHCHKPTPLVLDDNTVRVYFGVRDEQSRTRTTFVDLDAGDLTKVKYIHDKPVLDLGKLGAFDDSGANVCSVLRNGNEVYMYFIGWNPSTTVHTRNSLGLAVSKDNGMTFTRMYDGAVLDRTKDEPYFTAAGDVIKDDTEWKVWYTSGTEWKIINGKPEISYHIKYGHSANGIDWIRDNISAIKPKGEYEINGRPCVIKENGIYRMWFSKRNMVDFRNDRNKGYRAAYAESRDGITWKEFDDSSVIDVSESGWDSMMIAYPYVRRIRNRLIMFYNGNGFGKTGFGYAECDE